MTNPSRDFAAFVTWLYAVVPSNEDRDTILSYVDSLISENAELKDQLAAARAGIRPKKQPTRHVCLYCGTEFWRLSTPSNPAKYCTLRCAGRAHGDRVRKPKKP